MSEYEKVAAILGREWRDWFLRYTSILPGEDLGFVDIYAEVAWNDARRNFKFANDYFAEFKDVFVSTFFS